MATLTDKIAIITGASAGIGAATARTLANAGAQLVLVARRQDRLEVLASELGGNHAVLAADMAQEDAPQQLFDFVMQRFGRADILINNAGILRTGSLEEFDLSELRPMIAINYESIVRSCYLRSEEHTSELQSLMRTSYAVFCLKKKT